MIKKVKKLCYGCNLDKFIWGNKDGHKYCVQCWNSLKALESIQVTPAIKQELPAVKKTYRIKPISKNRQEALKTYRRRREKHFKDYPVCQYPGCKSTEVTLHHGKGRIGAFLTDKRWFKSLCWPHHKYCEENPKEAIRLGLSYKRLENER